ncbi:WIZ protein, partial [Leiothrix lutea]|nr:WIZ protein [Leiothrix lutea]
WISRAPSPPFQDLSPPFQDPQPAADVAAGPAFPGRAKGPGSCRRKVPEAAGPCPRWALPGVDVPAAQSWTVNAEDSVERLLPAAPCGSYVCGVLLEEPPKHQEEEEEEEEEEEDDNNPSVFTCIECSIYFRRKEHLLEHMLQHNRGAERADAADGPAARCRFRCGECGWALGDPAALDRHRRLHRESREKIIEEIQKLNAEFPDEGREARLQCPKCVFGTNSSKIFVQHAKMHVKERKEGASRSSSGLFGDGGGGAAGHGLYKALRGEGLPAAGKAPSSCALCGFPAPTEHILKEHLRYAHSSPFSWQPDAFPEDPNQPGTSRDSYSPARHGPADLFGQSERLFPAPPRESSSHLEPATPTFALAPPRCDKSHGAATKRDPQGLRHARKGLSHQNLGFPGFSSPQSCSLLRKRAA